MDAGGEGRGECEVEDIDWDFLSWGAEGGGEGVPGGGVGEGEGNEGWVGGEVEHYG